MAWRTHTVLHEYSEASKLIARTLKISYIDVVHFTSMLNNINVDGAHVENKHVET